MKPGHIAWVGGLNDQQCREQSRLLRRRGLCATVSSLVVVGIALCIVPRARADVHTAAVTTIPAGQAAAAGQLPETIPSDHRSGQSAAVNEPGGSRISNNILWPLAAGFLVMFMQAGFALVDTGLCRAKNAAHTISMNLMIYALGCFSFWFYGFAVGWGNWSHGSVPPGWHSVLGTGAALLKSGIGIGSHSDGSFEWGLLGTSGFCLTKLVDNVGVMTLFFFMMVFFAAAATIPIGAMAERWAWKNFCLYGLGIALPFGLYANWVWGGGWLAQTGRNWHLGHGAVDFAGSGVVHALGGTIALAGAIVLGPRIGKYVNGKPRAFPGHHIPMVVLGTFILAFGWFGFNPGSTLAGTDLRIASIVVNTVLASAAGAIATMLTMIYVKGLKPDPSLMCNGLLAGLVAITAPSAFVSSWAAAVIGAIAGVLVVYSVFFWENHGVDDVVGAISIHGVNGLWGVVSVGIFANGKYGAGWNGVVRDAWVKSPLGYDGVRGLLYGDATQLWAQLLNAAVLAAFAFVVAYVWFKFSNVITPIRVSREAELQGLDIPEMGALGYPDFTLASHGGASSSGAFGAYGSSGGGSGVFRKTSEPVFH